MASGAGREAVLGVGDAVTDAVVRLPPGGLGRLGLRAGSCACVDEAGERALLAELGPGPPPRGVPGGSAANVVKGLARLGRRARLLSALGDDAAGPRYREALGALGVDVGAVAEVAGARSPICYCLVAPELAGERTMRTFLGNCGAAKPAPAPGSLRDVALVHLEGYAFYSEGFAEAVAAQARREGARVSLDAGSAELVLGPAGGAMAALLRAGAVDVVFANEEEARALARRLEPEPGAAGAAAGGGGGGGGCCLQYRHRRYGGGSGAARRDGRSHGGGPRLRGAGPRGRPGRGRGGRGRGCPGRRHGGRRGRLCGRVPVRAPAGRPPRDGRALRLPVRGAGGAGGRGEHRRSGVGRS